jgi:hypothetical protein
MMTPKPPSVGSKSVIIPTPISSQVGAIESVENPAKNSVKVVQNITRDPKTGVEKETTEVSVHIPTSEINGDSEHKLIGTEEEIAAHIEAAKDIVENLKVQGILKEVGKSDEDITNKKRVVDPEFDDALDTVEDEERENGFLSRLWNRRNNQRKKERGLRVEEPVETALIVLEPALTPIGRLKLATVGLVAGVVAVGVAPYFLG